MVSSLEEEYRKYLQDQPQQQPQQNVQPSQPSVKPRMSSLEEEYEAYKASQPQVIDGNTTLTGGVSFKEGMQNIGKEVGKGLKGVLNSPSEMWNSIKDATTTTVDNLKSDPSLSKDLLGAGFQSATSLPFTVAQSVANIPEALSSAYQGRQFEQKVNLPSSGQELGSRLADGAIDLLHKTMNKSQAEMEALKKKREARDLAYKQQQERYNKLPLAQLAGEFALPGGNIARNALKTGLMRGVGEGATWGALTTTGSLEDRVKGTASGGALGGATHIGARTGSKLLSNGQGGLEELANKAQGSINDLTAKAQPVIDKVQPIVDKAQETLNRFKPEPKEQPINNAFDAIKGLRQSHKEIVGEVTRENNIKKLADTTEVYRNYLKAVKRQYGSTKNLKDIAMADTKNYEKAGFESSAMKDYKKLVELRNTKNNLSHVADDLSHVKQEKGINTPKNDSTGLKNDSRMSDTVDSLGHTNKSATPNTFKPNTLGEAMNDPIVETLVKEMGIKLPHDTKFNHVAIQEIIKAGKNPKTWRGGFDPVTKEFYLNGNLSEIDMLETIAHELRHEWQRNIDWSDPKQSELANKMGLNEKSWEECQKVNQRKNNFYLKFGESCKKAIDKLKRNNDNMDALTLHEQRLVKVEKERFRRYNDDVCEADARFAGAKTREAVEDAYRTGQRTINSRPSGRQNNGGRVRPNPSEGYRGGTLKNGSKQHSVQANRSELPPHRNTSNVRYDGLSFTIDSLGDINDNINQLKNSAKSHKNIKALKKLEAERDKAIENYYDIPKKKPNIKGSGLNWIGRTFSPTTTELDIIHPSLKYAMRKYEYNVALKGNKYSAEIKSYIDKVTKMPTEARAQYDLALKNSNKDLIDAYNAKYGLTEDWNKVRNVLDNLHNEAKNAGIDVGYVDDYFPRKMKDYTAYLDNYADKTRFEKHLREIDPDNKLTEAQKARELDKMLKNPTRNGNPSYTKGRKVDEITPEMNPYYEDSLSALTNYVSSITNAIEMNKFFGKGKNVEETIGNYVKKLIDEGKIKASDEVKLKEILDARFNPKGMDNWLSVGKNTIYATTLGNFVNAFTQAGDLAFSLYKYGFYDTIGGIAKKFSKKRISRKELGIEQISNEFANNSTSSKVVNKIFKLVGLDKLDGLGKETMINSAHIKFQKMAQNPSKDFLKELDYMFGDEAKQVLEDLKAGKRTENVNFMLFNEVCNFQPTTPSEMPINYLKGGNARILYTLKSFTIKQMDAFRNEAIRKIQKGQVKEGLRNLFSLGILMVGAGSTTSSVQDAFLGKEIRMEDIRDNELLKLFGLSKYAVNKSERDGWLYSIISSVLPPVSLVDDIYKDFDEYRTKGMEIGKARSIKHIPIIGKPAYWWYGRGADKKKEDFKKYRKEDYEKAIKNDDVELIRATDSKLTQKDYTVKEANEMYTKAKNNVLDKKAQKYMVEYLRAKRTGNYSDLEKVTQKYEGKVPQEVLERAYQNAKKAYEEEEKKKAH